MHLFIYLYLRHFESSTLADTLEALRLIGGAAPPVQRPSVGGLWTSPLFWTSRRSLCFLTPSLQDISPSVRLLSALSRSVPTALGLLAPQLCGALHPPISLSHVAAPGFLIVLFCHLFTVHPVSSTLLRCVMQEQLGCFPTHTQTGTHTQSILHFDAMQNWQYLARVLSLLMTASQSQKRAFTLADSNRLTRCRFGIIKVIYHIRSVFFLTQTITWVNRGALRVCLSGHSLLSAF